MSQEPTDSELKLAEKVNELEDAALRPAFTGGGIFAAAVNFLQGKVTRGIVTLFLGIFIAYSAWQSFNSSQQLFSELQSKRSETRTAVAEAIALNTKTHEKTNAQATLESEIQKTEGDAQTAEAEYLAASHDVDGMSAQLAKIRADIARTQAQADAAKAEADAQNQIIDGLPAATAQKKAEVETAEADVAKEIESDKYLVLRYSCQVKLILSLGCP